MRLRCELKFEVVILRNRNYPRDQLQIMEERVEDVTNLIASIIPPGRNDQIKTKFVYNWDQKRPKRTRKRKNKKRTQDKLIKDLTLPRLGLTYVDMMPIHNLWLQYMENILCDHLGKEIPAVHDPGYENFSLLLMRADYNGAVVKVIRSRCSSLIGKSGILAMETKETLKVLQENDELITIPKNESVFEVRVHNLVLTIFGKHINMRPAERSVKKVKQFMDMDI